MSEKQIEYDEDVYKGFYVNDTWNEERYYQLLIGDIDVGIPNDLVDAVYSLVTEALKVCKPNTAYTLIRAVLCDRMYNLDNQWFERFSRLDYEKCRMQEEMLKQMDQDDVMRKEIETLSEKCKLNNNLKGKTNERI